MATTQHYCLRWNNYVRHITSAFDNLRANDDFVDVTLCCDGQKIKAHKILLSACSGYFKEIFKENPCPHPVIIFKFIKYEDLFAIIEFMYQGEVNVQQEALQSFLQTAELLSVQGLTPEQKEKTNNIQCNKPRIPEKQIKTIPATVRTITESSVQQPPTDTSVNIQNPKKRKITFTDDEIFASTVEFAKEDSEIKSSEIQYVTSTLKIDVPEYIEISEPNQIVEEPHQNQQPVQEETNQIPTQATSTQFNSEYEILTESDADGKFQQNDERESEDIDDGAELGTPIDEFLQCKICNRQLQSISALKRHNASKHDSLVSKHDCTMCKKSFKTKWSLSTHKSRFHRDVRLKESIKMDFTFE